MLPAFSTLLPIKYFIIAKHRCLWSCCLTLLIYSVWIWVSPFPFPICQLVCRHVKCLLGPYIGRVSNPPHWPFYCYIQWFQSRDIFPSCAWTIVLKTLGFLDVSAVQAPGFMGFCLILLWKGITFFTDRSREEGNVIRVSVRHLSAYLYVCASVNMITFECLNVASLFLTCILTFRIARFKDKLYDLYCTFSNHIFSFIATFRSISLEILW